MARQTRSGVDVASRTREGEPVATLETERLILRDFVPGDWDALDAIVTDPGVMRYTHFADWDELRRRQWFAWMVQDASTPHPWHNNWAITLRSGGQLIGWLFVGTTAGAAANGTCGCGYALNPRAWNQGYMTEALIATIAYAFAVLGARRIVADCDTPNVASARVMQKSGMTFAGTYYATDFEGNWAESDHYQITAPAADAR